MFGALLEVEMSKKCTPLWREARLQAKKLKTPHIWNTFRSCDVEKVHAVAARSTFRSKHAKNTTCLDHFLTFRCCFAWQAQGIVHLVKSEQNMRVLSHFQKRWQAWDIWRGSAKMHCPWQAQYKRHVHQSCWEAPPLMSWEGLHFGADLQVCWDDSAWQVQHFVYDLASLFRGARISLDRWSGKIAKRIGTRLSALHSTFHFWRKSRRIALFLMLSLENKWGSLAELLRFSRCQGRKSCWIAAFLMLSSSKTEEVSQNSFVFKLDR